MRDHRGLLSRAEGCWTFDARDRMSRSSRLLVHPIIAAAENAQTKTRTPSRESGFVLRRKPEPTICHSELPLTAAERTLSRGGANWSSCPETAIPNRRQDWLSWVESIPSDCANRSPRRRG